MVCRRNCVGSRFIIVNATGYRMAAACAVLLAFAGLGRAGTLSNFETGTLEGWAVDAGAGSVTLTPDNTTSSEGSFSLRVEVATGGLDVERIKTERKARQLQAQSVLSEFEVELGLKKPDAVKEAAPFPSQSTAAATPQKMPEAG